MFVLFASTGLLDATLVRVMRYATIQFAGVRCCGSRGFQIRYPNIVNIFCFVQLLLFLLGSPFVKLELNDILFARNDVECQRLPELPLLKSSAARSYSF